MGEVVLSMMVSLDGYFEGPSHELDWHLVDEETHQYFNETLRPMGAFLGGRRVYELMESYWPTADEDPNAPPTIREFAEIWRDMPKVVYSRSLDQTGPNATIVRQVDRGEVEALKAKLTGDLVVGGAELGGEFLRQDLVDRLWIYVNPIVLGRGNRLFAESDRPLNLELSETHTFSNGLVLLSYRIVR